MRASKTEKLLAHLKAGKSITPLQCWKKFGIYRTSSVIHKLRRRGFDIVTDSVTVKGEDFAKYSLKKS